MSTFQRRGGGVVAKAPGLSHLALPLGGTVVAYVLLGGAVQVLATQSSADTAFSAAQVALAALRSQVDAPSSIELYSVARSMHAVTAAEAIEVLAQFPKPVRCRCALEDRLLVISCDTVRTASLIRMQRDFANESEEEWRGVVERAWGHALQDPTVLLEEPDRSVLVPLHSVVAFVRDYETPFSFGIKHVPTRDLPPGAHAVIVVSPALGFTAEIWNPAPR